MIGSRLQPAALLARRAVVAALFLLIACLASPSRAQENLDLQIVIISTGSGTDDIAVSYGTKPSREQVEADFAQIAERLAVPTPKVKIATVQGITSAEAKIAGLTNWSTGVVNLDPLVWAFRRFGFLRVMCLCMGSFRLTSPTGNETRGKVRWETQQQSTGASTTIDYKVWVDQTQGVPSEVPTTQNRWLTGKTIGALAAILAVLAAGAFLIFNTVRNNRRAAAVQQADP
jgi:hypothetical protein